MNKETKEAIERYKRGLQRLEEGISISRDELDKDGVIQRFEFTFELLWKALKIFLEEKGHIYRSPKDCFQGAFKIGLIDDEKQVLQLLEDRNRMSHVYSEKESQIIYERIKETHVHTFNAILTKIEKTSA